MQRKIIEEETIFDHYTSKLNIQEFAQIMIDGNKPKLFVELLALKSEECQFEESSTKFIT